MATFFGKILKGIGSVVGGGGSTPSFTNLSNFSQINPLSFKPLSTPSTGNISNGIASLAVSPPSAQSFGEKLSNMLDLGSKALDVASQVKEVVSKNPLPSGTVDSGVILPEVTVTGKKPTLLENGLEAVKKGAEKLANGQPIVTMGQEFSIGDNLKIPLYIGLGLLAFKLFTGRGR